MVRKNLEIARGNLKNTGSGAIEGEMEGLYSSVVTLGLYEKQILETREWPYNAGILRRLVVTILSPAVVYFIKVFFSSRIDF